MTILFWLLLSLVIYCYFGYPFLISLISKFFPKPILKSAIFPTISIVISLYNEEDVIGLKLNNLLNLDYPPEKMEILIGSDGSTDQTIAIINGFKDPRIHVLAENLRQGKVAIIQKLMAQSKNEIIIFNDARQTLDQNALKNLVKNFADPHVGCVSGELIFRAKQGGTAQGINFYWKYEKFIRWHESRIHSMLGATGAIYAIRKELFVPGPTNVVLDDMFTPFKIIEKGFRVVFDDTAYAYDEVADDPKEEYRRKTRTLYGNYQIFSLFPGLFNPFQSPIAIQLFSHKFLRVIVPFLLIFIFGINAALVDNFIYRDIFILQILFYILALMGGVLRNHQQGFLKIVSKICYIPYVFCLLNVSAFVGFLKFIGAKQEITWKKARER